MNIQSTTIQGVVHITTESVGDHRGEFSRCFCMTELSKVMGNRHVRQINHSLTKSIGAVRGMHFQHQPHAEMKLIRCVRGRVWDVTVDLRRNSSTFLKWHALELSDRNKSMIVIPEGCAHGFQVLEPDSELLYLHTADYCKQAEGGVRFDDPAIAIQWPLPITDASTRDRSHTLIKTGFQGVQIFDQREAFDRSKNDQANGLLS